MSMIFKAKWQPATHIKVSSAAIVQQEEVTVLAVSSQIYLSCLKTFIKTIKPLWYPVFQ